MTTPTPDKPETGTDTPPASPPNDPAATPTPPESTDPPTDAPERDATDWKAHARTWENRAKRDKDAAAKAVADKEAADAKLAAVLKAAGLAPDDDPAKAAEKAAAERDALATENRALRIERAAEKAGRKAGADVDALIDSRGFVAALADLDPTSSDFTDRLDAAVKTALEANPRLRATTSPPPRSVTDTATGGLPERELAPGMDRMRAAYAAAPPSR